MSNYITWNGIRSDALGLTVEHYPNMNRPARKYTVADVPGRNGSAYILQNAWSEVVQSYEISAKSPVASFKGVAEWLSSANGYAVLQDSYDPLIYRMAVCVNPFEVQNSLNRAGRALIQFNCRPERYIVSEDETLTTPGSLLITNETNHEAHPLIKIEGQGYPSMLPTTDRTDVNNTFENEYNIEGLGAQKVRWNFIGLTNAYTGPDSHFIAQDPSKITSHSETAGRCTFTATAAGCGIGMNRSVKPNTTYTVSLLYDPSNTQNGQLAIVQTDKNGDFVSPLGSIDLVPSATRKEITFTTYADAYWVVVILLPKAAGTFYFYDIQFNLGDTAQSYAPYSDSTSSSFRIGDTMVKLTELADYMYIDCETMNAYRGSGENLNSELSITDLNGNPTPNFPRLIPGDTAISSDDWNWITKLTITPRFWTL